MINNNDCMNLFSYLNFFYFPLRFYDGLLAVSMYTALYGANNSQYVTVTLFRAFFFHLVALMQMQACI